MQTAKLYLALALAFALGTRPAMAERSRSEPQQPVEQSRQSVVQHAVKHRVQMELLPTYHIAVPVRVNGKGPYRMIFDLGAPVNLVSGRVALAAGLISEEVARMPTLFGIRGQATLKSFQVGGVVAKNVPVMIVDHPAIERARPVLGQIDGIVGQSFFGRYRITFDYANRYIEFEPTGHEPRDVMMQMLDRLFGPRRPRPIGSSTLWGIAVVDRGDARRPGVLVAKLWPQSPAAVAGLREGDTILEIDGHWTDSVSDAVEAATEAEPGKPVPVLIERDGKQITIHVTPEQGL